jgi:hypothetical protein
MKELLKPEHLVPNAIHVAMSTALIVLSAEILKKLHRACRGIREIKEGHEEMRKGIHELGRFRK